MQTSAAVVDPRVNAPARELAPAHELEAMLREARAAWPDLLVRDDDFIAYVAQRLPPGESLAQWCTRDLYLALGCAGGEARAIAAFERHCLDGIDGALAHLSAAPDVVSEVKQRLRCTLFVGDGKPPGITNFSGRGSIRAWVRAIVLREALALMRPLRKAMPLDEVSLQKRLLPADDPEISFLKRTYRHEFKTAFTAALARLSDRERLLLKLQLLDGLSIDKLGELYRVHRSTAARWLEQARNQLIKATLTTMRTRLRVEPDALNSILRLISSQLEMNLGSLVRRKPRP